MSNISSSYDALKARLVAVLPNHAILTNPYAPSENSESALKQGQGIRLGAATNSHRAFKLLSVQRTVDVVITRRFYASEMNRTGKETAEKALLEDQFLMLQDIESNPTLGVSSAVTAFGYESDAGIEYVFSDDKPFLMIVTTFLLEYLESL